MMRKRKPVRIVPTFRSGKEHAGHPDGYVVAEEDRIVRELPPPPEKASDEPTSGNGAKEGGDGG